LASARRRPRAVAGGGGGHTQVQIMVHENCAQRILRRRALLSEGIKLRRQRFLVFALLDHGALERAQLQRKF
jgi:UDP-N-acetylglucosamine:LPS N-acetylglucosamine transferase